MYYSCQDPEGGKGDGIFALAIILGMFGFIALIALLMNFLCP